MTNYNDRLDKILSIFSGGITARGSDKGGYPTYFSEPYPLWVEQRKRAAKQALTSLIKELVEEAKPLVVVSREALEENGSDTVRLDAVTDGLNQFEQNILKLLEEK